MQRVKFETVKDGIKINGYGTQFSMNTDLDNLITIYKGWKQLNEYQEKLGVRRVNIPESVSECIPCILLNLLRTNNVQINGLAHSSMDAIDPESGLTYQIKACSTTAKNNTGSPSSFGPRSEWDKLIYAHFDCENDIVKLYEFDEDINSIKVSRTQTFAEQCAQGRRPRFNMLPRVKELQPIVTFSLRERKIIDPSN